MSTINFNVVRRGEASGSNYRLLGAPVELKSRVIPVHAAPGTDGWEDDGGAVAPPPYEVTQQEIGRREVRMRLGRHQRSAKIAVPRESIKVVPLAKPAPVEVAVARLKGASPEDEKIAALEAQVRKLLGVVRQREDAEQGRKMAIERLERLFDSKRLR